MLSDVWVWGKFVTCIGEVKQAGRKLLQKKSQDF